MKIAIPGNVFDLIPPHIEQDLAAYDLSKQWLIDYVLAHIATVGSAAALWTLPESLYGDLNAQLEYIKSDMLEGLREFFIVDHQIDEMTQIALRLVEHLTRLLPTFAPCDSDDQSQVAQYYGFSTFGAPGNLDTVLQYR